MSKHVDLIAVAALLVVFALASRAHGMLHIGPGPAHLFRLRPMNPVVILPHVPHVPRLPRV